MLDCNGYRPNVAIVLLNRKDEVFLCKRIKENTWQFPQGGIKHGEQLVQAMYRELYEETGLKPNDVHIMGRTRYWLHYKVPKIFIKNQWKQYYKGQKQIWFLLRLIAKDSNVCLDISQKPEFDAWRWNQYWDALNIVVKFKKQVYIKALNELSKVISQNKKIF